MSAKQKAAMQMVLSLIVVCLCVYKLVDKGSLSEEKTLYWGGLLGIVGAWLPSPSESQERQIVAAKSPEEEV